MKATIEITEKRRGRGWLVDCSQFGWYEHVPTMRAAFDFIHSQNNLRMCEIYDCSAGTRATNLRNERNHREGGEENR